MKLCGFEVGLDQPFFLIAGPCVIESMQLQLDTAGKLKEITGELGIPFIFKSSFDKANRTSGTSFRGPGLEEGLKVLAEVKRQLGVPVLTDVHEYTPMDEVASRRRRAADAGVPVPADRLHPEGRQRRQAGQHQEGPVPVAVGNEARRRQGARRPATSRSWSASAAPASATTTWCRDMRSLAVMRDTGCPVVFDATHSVQLPGGAGRQVRRPARIRAGAVARGDGGRHRRHLHGNPSRSGQGAERRPERLAAAEDARAAGNADGARPHHQDATASSNPSSEPHSSRQPER